MQGDRDRRYERGLARGGLVLSEGTCTALGASHAPSGAAVVGRPLRRPRRCQPSVAPTASRRRPAAVDRRLGGASRSTTPRRRPRLAKIAAKRTITLPPPADLRSSPRRRTRGRRARQRWRRAQLRHRLVHSLLDDAEVLGLFVEVVGERGSTSRRIHGSANSLVCCAETRACLSSVFCRRSGGAAGVAAEVAGAAAERSVRATQRRSSPRGIATFMLGAETRWPADECSSRRELNAAVTTRAMRLTCSRAFGDGLHGRPPPPRGDPQPTSSRRSAPRPQPSCPAAAQPLASHDAGSLARGVRSLRRRSRHFLRRERAALGGRRRARARRVVRGARRRRGGGHFAARRSRRRRRRRRRRRARRTRGARRVARGGRRAAATAAPGADAHGGRARRLRAARAHALQLLGRTVDAGRARLRRARALPVAHGGGGGGGRPPRHVHRRRRCRRESGGAARARGGGDRDRGGARAPRGRRRGAPGGGERGRTQLAADHEALSVQFHQLKRRFDSLSAERSRLVAEAERANAKWRTGVRCDRRSSRAATAPTPPRPRRPRRAAAAAASGCRWRRSWRRCGGS